MFGHSATICLQEIVDNVIQLHVHDASFDVPQLASKSNIGAHPPGKDDQHAQLGDEVCRANS